MKSPDKTKAKMKFPTRAVNPRAVRSGSGVTDDAPGSTVPTTPSDIDTEVVARARRRHFSNAEKRRILQAVDQCTQPGEIGALLRREGVYSSSLSTWRRQRDAADLAALAPQKRGPKIDPGRAEAQHIAQLVRENERLKTRLDKALLVIEVQKKVATLLGLASADDSAGST
jgi:transposase